MAEPGFLLDEGDFVEICDLLEQGLVVLTLVEAQDVQEVCLAGHRRKTVAVEPLVDLAHDVVAQFCVQSDLEEHLILELGFDLLQVEIIGEIAEGSRRGHDWSLDINSEAQVFQGIGQLESFEELLLGEDVEAMDFLAFFGPDDEVGEANFFAFYQEFSLFREQFIRYDFLVTHGEVFQPFKMEFFLLSFCQDDVRDSILRKCCSGHQ